MIEGALETANESVGLEGIFIAPVVPRAIEAVVEIDREWNPKPWGNKLFGQELSNRSAVFRAAYLGDLMIGYVLVHVILDEAHIVSLGVKKEWRGRGVGRYILEEIIMRLLREGVCSITLEVRVSNMIARALYESAGFKAAGIRRNYYSDNGEDALTLRFSSTE